MAGSKTKAMYRNGQQSKRRSAASLTRSEEHGVHQAVHDIFEAARNMPIEELAALISEPELSEIQPIIDGEVWSRAINKVYLHPQFAHLLKHYVYEVLEEDDALIYHRPGRTADGKLTGTKPPTPLTAAKLAVIMKSL